MFRRADERQALWERNQIHFAEVAYEYPCCDVPTITQCLLCTHDPERCKNKAEVVKALANYKEWGKK